MFLDTGRTTIRHLHLVASQGDPLLLRLRAESQLNAASLTVPGLPPSAILLVRTLKTPPLVLYPSAALPPVWENAVRNTLTDLTRQAARPINTPADPKAPAVLFADYSELLACLALDLAANRAAGCWWWRSLLGEFSLTAALDAWLTHPREAPTALAILDRRAQAIPFLRLTPPQFNENLVQAMLTVFNIIHLRFIFSGNAPGVLLTQAPVSAPEDLSQPQSAPAASSSPQPGLAEKTFFASELVPVGLSHIAWTLLNLARIVRYSPTALAGVTTAEKFYEKLLSVVGRQTMNIQEKVSFPEQEKSLLENVSGERKTTLETPNPKRPTTITADEIVQNTENTENLPLAKLIETKYGGIFYLLNVAIVLELYSDFTMPAYKGLDISPWDLLAFLGLEFIGEDFAKDSLWRLLAEFAGRGGDEGNRTSLNGDFLGDNRAPFSGMFTGIGYKARLTRLARTIRTRLLAAFDETDFGKLAKQIFHEPARIFISATRIDVNFSLETHPIEIRIAGLDRNIGWLPAAGMEIYYHYD